MNKLLQFRTKTGVLVGHHVHGYGFKRDPGVHGQNGFYAAFHQHPAAKMRSAILPDAVMLEGFAPKSWNQVGTGSCTGHAFACAETTSLAAHGHALPHPVLPRFRYATGLAVDRASPDRPLVDEGAQPRALVRAASEYGIVTFGQDQDPQDSPEYEIYLSAHVTDDPKLGELEVASRQLVLGYNAIADGDPEKDVKVVQALAGKSAVLIAVEAGCDAFQNYDGTGVLGYTGSDPDHMNCIIGYALVRWLRSQGMLPPKMPALSEDDVLFLVQNSWGTDWGISGRALCTRDFLMRGTFSALVANVEVR